MPKRPINHRPSRLTKPDPGAAQPSLFINIQVVGGHHYHCYLVNIAGDKWRLAGPKGMTAIVDTAKKFAEFSGLPIYMNGERFDGLKPTLMKGNAE